MIKSPVKNTEVVLRSAPQKQVICRSDHVAAKIFVATGYLKNGAGEFSKFFPLLLILRQLMGLP